MTTLGKIIIALILTWFFYLAFMTYHRVYIKEELPHDFDQYAPSYEIPYEESNGKG